MVINTDSHNFSFVHPLKPVKRKKVDTSSARSFELTAWLRQHFDGSYSSYSAHLFDLTRSNNTRLSKDSKHIGMPDLVTSNVPQHANYKEAYPQSFHTNTCNSQKYLNKSCHPTIFPLYLIGNTC